MDHSGRTIDQSGQKKTRKSTTKAMKKSDREELLHSLQNIDENILLSEVVNELGATFDE